MKRRKIRYDRLLLVIVLFIGIVSSLIYGSICLYKFIFIKDTTKYKNLDEIVYPMTVDRFSIPEINLEELVIEEEPELINLGEFRLTGYCNCEICCGVWAGGPCFNGEMPESGWTIAVDPDVIPINSLVVIDGHTYKAQDTGSAINENRIDVYCDTHKECFADFCNKYAEVYLINE